MGNFVEICFMYGVWKLHGVGKLQIDIKLNKKIHTHENTFLLLYTMKAH